MLRANVCFKHFVAGPVPRVNLHVKFIKKCSQQQLVRQRNKSRVVLY